METLTFLKFWRNLAAGAAAAERTDCPAAESDDEGSFFELDIALSRIHPGRNDNHSALLIPPTDPVFLRNRVMPLESTALKPLSQISKSRALASGLKRPRRQRATDHHHQRSPRSGEPEVRRRRKKYGDLFTPKGRVRQGADASDNTPVASRSRDSRTEVRVEPKRSSGDCVRKYLEMTRSLCVRVCRKQGKLPGTASVSPSPSKSQPPPSYAGRRRSESNIPAGLRVVCKQLGKSRPRPSTTSAASPPAPRRRDDSLLLQHDGIQSAIQHCKISFSSSSFSDWGRESNPARSSCDF